MTETWDQLTEFASVAKEARLAPAESLFQTVAAMLAYPPAHSYNQQQWLAVAKYRSRATPKGSMDLNFGGAVNV